MQQRNRAGHSRIALAIAMAWSASTLGCGSDDTSDAQDDNAASREAAQESGKQPEKTGDEAKPEEHAEHAQSDTSTGAGSKGAADKSEPEAKTDPESKFCGVLDVTRNKCQRCHGETPVAGAPMPLVKYEDFIAPGVSDKGRRVFELVRDRVHNEQRPMPPAPAQLSTDALSLIDSWVDHGALKPAEDCPEAKPDKAARPSDSVTEWPADCEEWHTFVAYDRDDPTKPYKVPAKTEEHPAWSFDAPWGDDKVQLLATRPITDNAKVIHHWILWDSKVQASLSGWAPGGIPDEVPNDVGLYMPTGAKSLTLDMHYYNLNGEKAEPDRSGVEVCITRTLRPKTAANIGLTGSAVVKAMSRGETPVACQVKADQDIHFLGINPHMHQLGVHAKLELTRGGKTSVLWDAPFSFMEQAMHPFENVVIKNGDVLTTTCTYVNNTPMDVAWGDSTNDEMCINWVRYYPEGAFECTRMTSTTQQKQ